MTISGYTVLIGGLASLLLLTACDEPEQWSAGDLRGYNHTLEGINWFEVNDQGPGIIGGNSCCIGLPSKWRPGLKAHVVWEVDPAPYAEFPSYKSGKFGEAYARHAANYKRYSRTVDIPDYGDEKCGLTVHFLPCHQVKVTASCYAIQHPLHPVKEPFQQKEPAVCPPPDAEQANDKEHPDL